MKESYAVAHFGKPLADITLADLTHYFAAEHEETDTIEFKSYYERNLALHNHKESGVLKTICAFLNSSGGLLIWGAPVGQTPAGRQVKVFTGALSPVEVLIEKDTFISRIASRIIPLSNLIQMHRIEVVADSYVYLFDVRQSIYKPHQFDNRYWIRLDGQSGVAPHYLIDALFKQVSYPNLGGYIKFGDCSARQGNLFLNFKVIIMNHSKSQNEHDVYFTLTATKGQFIRQSNSDVIMLDGHQFYRENFASILTYSHGPFQDLILQIPVRETTGTPDAREIRLMLTFGGKSSPMKRSDYTLLIQRYGNNEHGSPERIKSIFDISSKVNLPMNEFDMSEEERVRQILEN
jgi:hypothetical protein